MTAKLINKLMLIEQFKFTKNLLNCDRLLNFNKHTKAQN